MFDFHRWLDWSREQTAALSRRGFEAAFTFNPESEATSNPAFFIDLETEKNVGRMIVWLTGDCGVTVLLYGSLEAFPLPEMPVEVTNSTFEDAFDRFVRYATS